MSALTTPAATALSAALAMAAALLVIPGPVRAAQTRAGREVCSQGAAWRRPWLPPALAVAVVAVGIQDGTRLALLLIGAVSTLGVLRLVHRQRERRDAEARSGKVLESCEILVAELRAGQPPAAALGLATVDWPELEPVATASRLGADVADAFTALSRSPGAGSLVIVSAAWRVAHRSGAGLADALAAVARLLRRQQQTRRVVTSELASARSTARMIAILPLVVLGFGSGVGGNPWHFLLDTPAGLVLLGCGLLLAFAGLEWIERIAEGVLRR